MCSKIFYIGLSRTGTTSLHYILKELGFKSGHYIWPLLNNEWEVVNNYDALGDTPIPLIYKECDEKYPNSKFILTTRNKDKWLDSMKWMFRDGRVIWNWPLSLGNYHRSIYGTNWYNRKVLNKAFENYHIEVRDYFKNRPNEFLEINIDNGFNIEELCKFLEIPLKPVQIIHSNERRPVKNSQLIKYYLRNYLINPTKKSIKDLLKTLKLYR